MVGCSTPTARLRQPASVMRSRSSLEIGWSVKVRTFRRARSASQVSRPQHYPVVRLGPAKGLTSACARSAIPRNASAAEHRPHWPLGEPISWAIESAAVHVDVEQVPVFLVLPLRQSVLRPHQRLADVGFAGDTTGTHFAAFDASGAIVGVVSLIVQPPDPRGAPCWRLRGMATDPPRQRQGVEPRSCAGLLDFVARSGGGAIWCNARLHAVGFYELFGFVTAGEVFEEPDIGPHVRMASHWSSAASR